MTINDEKLLNSILRKGVFRRSGWRYFEKFFWGQAPRPPCFMGQPMKHHYFGIYLCITSNAPPPKDSNLTSTSVLPPIRFSCLRACTYGSECWILETTDRKKINSFELWCYRRLLRINWTDKRTNEYVLSKIGTSERLLSTIVKRKMAFVGHIFRKDGICKHLLTGTEYGK